MVPEVFKSWFNKRYTVVIGRNGKPSISTSGHKYTVTKVHSEWLSRQPEIDGWEYVSEDDIEEFVEDSAPDEPNDPEKLTNEELIKLKRDNLRNIFEGMYSIDYKDGKSFQIVAKYGVSNKTVPISSVVQKLRNYMLDNAIACPAKEEVTDMIGDLLGSAREDAVDKALEAIKFNPDLKGEFSFKKFTQEVFSFYKIKDTAINRKMFKHMMWQIKRAAFSKTTEQSYWYLFFSRVQGIGKSRLLRHLASPFIGGLNSSVNIEMLLDENSKKAIMTDGSVLLDFQELGMGKGTKDVDIAPMIKQVQDMDVLKNRQMYSDFNVETMCYAVFASSTNLRIEEVMPDGTGYRRFFSFDFGLTAEDKREYSSTGKWKDIDKFFSDNIKLAYSVLDENEEPVIRDNPEKGTMLFSELCDIQDGYSASVDIMSQWMDENQMVVSTEKEEGFVEVFITDLYNMYVKWDAKNGGRHYDRRVFQTILAGRKSIRPHKNDDGKLYYWVKRGK